MADSKGHERADATIDDVAAHFGVTTRTVRRWLSSTDMPHRRAGGTLRFNLDEVDSWAARGGRPADATEEVA
jgi:excisionase family DNA binding protein